MNQKLTILLKFPLTIALLAACMLVACTNGGAPDPVDPVITYQDDGVDGHWVYTDGVKEPSLAPHIYGESETMTSPVSPEEPGQGKETCTACSHINYFQIPYEQESEHTINDKWKHNETHHWKECADGCDIADGTKHYLGDHEFVKDDEQLVPGKVSEHCTICGRENIREIENYWTTKLGTGIDDLPHITIKPNNIGGTGTIAETMYRNYFASPLQEQAQRIAAQYAENSDYFSLQMHDIQTGLATDYEVSRAVNAMDTNAHAMDSMTELIKGLLTTSEETSAFDKTLQAYELAHYLKQRQGDVVAAQTESFSQDMGQFTTLCQQLGITDTSNMDVVINTLTGQMMGLMPGEDKGIVNKYYLIQQYQDYNKAKGFVDDLKFLNLVECNI